jgi:hypothetical protein
MRATDMNDIPDTARDQDTRIENFAAELTRAVYPLVLRRGPEHGWLKLELSLWKGLMETTKTWVRHKPQAVFADDLETWREGLLGALSGSVLSIALNHSIDGCLCDVESELHRTFHLLTTRYSHAG